jgi:hypothetical protein
MDPGAVLVWVGRVLSALLPNPVAQVIQSTEFGMVLRGLIGARGPVQLSHYFSRT